MDKYRAWDKDDKRMLYLPLSGIESDHSVAAKLIFGESYHDDFYTHDIDFELMQCTGRKDKNSKEIYKSDIIRLGYSDGSFYAKPVEVKYGLHRVGYDSDAGVGATALGFYFSPYPDSDSSDFAALKDNPMGIGEQFDWDNAEYSEVIGNIYEHKELLESRA